MIALLFTLLVASLACQTLRAGAPASTSVPTPDLPPGTEAGSVPTTAAAASTDAAPESGAAVGEAELGPGDFNLLEPATGLADLASYKATLILSFEGSQYDEPQQWTKTYVLLAARDPATRQLTLEKEGDLGDLAPEFWAERDGVAYAWGGEQGCRASALADGPSLIERLEPAAMLDGVLGADAAGNETINGLAADHYTFDERAFGNLGLAEADGELWLAAEGGFVVRYLLNTTAGADYFGDGLEGTLTWDYELTDANQAPAFELHADCPAGMVDAPLPEDAADVVAVPGLLAYSTGLSPAETATFYEAEMPGLGWVLAGAPLVAEVGVRLDFARAAQTLAVVISAGEGETSVHILLDVPDPASVE